MMTWVQLAPGIYEGKPLDGNLASLIRISNIPGPTFFTHRLHMWEARGDESWWDRVRNYASGIFNHPFLTLLGQTGVGKTHLALGIAFEWIEQRRTVLYYQVESLLDALRDGYRLWEKDGKEGYHSILSFTKNASLLILDDLGAQKETDWSGAKLDQIIDYRYINKKAMVVTSNLAMDRLPPRIADRLMEGTLIHLKGESYRLKGKLNSEKASRSA